jgi:hypothetical protein
MQLTLDVIFMDSKQNINLEVLVASLLRTPPKRNVLSFFTDVSTNFSVEDTKALSHCYVLNLGRNNRPDIKDLTEYLFGQIVNYSIPAKEIEKAKQKDSDDNQTMYMTRLAEKARKLFVQTDNSGEAGEVLLYTMVQEVLGIPQLLCKMPKKTNSNVHYHGVDGIHVSVDKNKKGQDTLSLYWGESKLKTNARNAISEAVKSLEGYLLADGGSQTVAERDLQLVQDNLNIVNEDLESALLQYLDKDGELYGHVNYKGICLIGFDYDKYPETPNSDITLEEITENVNCDIKSWLKTLKGQVKKYKHLDTFEMHVFLIPFPSVEEFKKAFLQELGIDINHESSK